MVDKDNLMKMIDVYNVERMIDVYSSAGQFSVKISILNRFVSILRSNPDRINTDEVYIAIEACISRIEDESFNPEVIRVIVSIIHNLDCTSLYAAKLIVFGLTNQSIRRYFTYDCCGFLTLSIKLLVQITGDLHVPHENSHSIFKAVLESACHINMNGVLLSEFRFVFLNELLELILKFALKYDLKRDSSAYRFMKTCLIEILFYNTEQKQLLKGYMRSVNEQGDLNSVAYTSDLINQIKIYTNTFSPIMLAEFYVILYDGLLSGVVTAESDTTELYEYLLMVFRLLGLFDGSAASSERHFKFKRSIDEKQLVVLNRLFVWSSDKYLQFGGGDNSRRGLINGRELFSNLVKTVILNDDGNNELKSETLQLIRHIIVSNPFVATSDDFLTLFVRFVMLKKKNADNDDTELLLLNVYSYVCADVIAVCIRKNKLDRFIVNFIKTADSVLSTVTSDDDMPENTTQIWPNYLYAFIEKNALTNTTSIRDNVSLFHNLIQNVENACLEILEGITDFADKRSVLMIELAIDLLLNIIKKCWIASGTSRISAKELFPDNLKSVLEQLIGRFCSEIIDNKHDSSVMKRFLELCVIWGDIKLAIIQFDGIDEIVPHANKTASKSATNFEFLHSCVGVHQWKTMYQRVVNFGDPDCIKLTNDLVLQKLRNLNLIHDESNTMATNCVRHLLLAPDVAWIRNNLPSVIPYLTVDDTLEVAVVLVQYYSNADDDTAIIRDGNLFSENRALIISVMLKTFMHLGRKLSDLNVSYLYCALVSLNFANIVNFEVNGEYMKDMKLYSKKLGKDVIERFAAAETRTEDDGDATVDVASRIRILFGLPVNCLHRETRKIVSLLVLILFPNIKPILAKAEPKFLEFLEVLTSDICLPSTFRTGSVFDFIRSLTCEEGIDKRFYYRLLFTVNDSAFRSGKLRSLFKCCQVSVAPGNLSDLNDIAIVGITYNMNIMKWKRKTDSKGYRGNLLKKYRIDSTKFCTFLMKNVITRRLSSPFSCDVTEDSNQCHLFYVSYMAVMVFAFENDDVALINNLAPYLESILQYPLLVETDPIIVRLFLKHLIIGNDQVSLMSHRLFSTLMSIVIKCDMINKEVSIHRLIAVKISDGSTITEYRSLLDDCSKALDSCIQSEDLSIVKIFWTRAMQFALTEEQRSFRTSYLLNTINAFNAQFKDRSERSNDEECIMRNVLRIIVIIIESDAIIPLTVEFLSTILSLIKSAVDSFTSMTLECVETFLVVTIIHLNMLTQHMCYAMCDLYKKLFKKFVEASQTENSELSEHFYMLANKMEKLTQKFTAKPGNFQYHTILFQFINLVRMHYSNLSRNHSAKMFIQTVLFHWLKLIKPRDYVLLTSLMPESFAFPDLLVQYENYFK